MEDGLHPWKGTRSAAICNASRIDPRLGSHSALVMKITYYLEVLSSWCHWAEPAWAELKARYAGRVRFEWRIALMSPGDFPASREQCDWFYRRSGGTAMRSPYMLHSGWFEASR